MGIGFKFLLKPKKKLFSRKAMDRAALIEQAVAAAEENGYNSRIYKNKIFCEFCVEGYLWLELKEDHVEGECQTNVAGPGFHVAAIEYLERLAAALEWQLDIDDETGYYDHRDFKKMRQEHFYQWFNGLIRLIVDQEEETEGIRYICWPLGYYLPDRMNEKTVVTPIRRFSYQELRGMLGSGMFMGFAQDFFVWNNVNRDAYYYRNSALVRLNKECNFMPSSRSGEDKKTNEVIIRLLEVCLVLDRSIPFPVKEYLELCRLADHEPEDVRGVSQLEGAYELGYKKGIVYREFGVLRFAVPGYFLMDNSADSKAALFYDGFDENWHNFRITGYETEGPAEFSEAMFQAADVEEIFEFPVQKARLKGAVYAREHEDGNYGIVSAQIIFKKQLTFITICYEEATKDWAVELLKKIETVDKKDEEDTQDGE